MCAPGGGGDGWAGVGGNGKCGLWDGDNDPELYGYGGKRWDGKGGEYVEYLLSFNQTSMGINLITNKSYAPGADRRYVERCCPPTKRGSSTVGFGCHDASAKSQSLSKHPAPPPPSFAG